MSTRSIVCDLILMARRYGPQRAPGQAVGPVVSSNPLGVSPYNTIVQKMALPTHVGTPSQEPNKWYENRDNSGPFLSEKRRGCVGCMVTPLVSRPTTCTIDMRIFFKRKRCAQCGKDKTHAYCILCHHYFHNMSRLLPKGEEKLISFPT